MTDALAGEMRPVLWRLARLDFDAVRGRPIVQYPEGALLLNDSGRDILALCDGSRTVSDIAGELAARYGADVDVLSDVREFLGRLVERELVLDARVARRR